MRTNIMLGQRVGPETKVLLTTSPAPGDGKTTVACSIAISLAQAGQRGVLIDCDLRRPRLPRIFDQPNDSGEASVLAGSLQLSEACSESGIPVLSLLTSGTPPLNLAELFHSENFSTLLRELRKSFDRIVIDSRLSFRSRIPPFWQHKQTPPLW